MGNSLVPIVRGFIQDTTDAISGKVGPLLESFTHKTADLVADNANDINTAEDGITQNVKGVMNGGGGDVPPGDVMPGGAPTDPVSAPGARNPGDLAPPADPVPGGDPVGTNGVGGCGKAGEPVDVVTGQYVAAKTDVDLPGVLSLVLRRAYASHYRGGRLVGPGWSCTLDIRVQISPDTIRFADDDCRILEYPHPRAQGGATLPTEGDRLPLAWDREADEIRILDSATGRTWHFTTLGAERTATGEVRPLTAVSDRHGNRIVIERDHDGLPTEVRHSGGYRIAVDTGYTAAGFRVEGLRLLDGTVGANGDQGSTLVAYQYDPHGRLVAVVDGTGVPFVYEYDAADRIVAWMDRLGYRFEYSYDQAGRVIRTAGEDGYLSGSFSYDPGNTVTAYCDSLGHATEYHYDRRGRIVKIVDPLGRENITEFDGYGRALSHTDPLGNTTDYSFDENGDPLQIVRPDGTRISAQYNAMRQPISVTNPNGATWVNEYDESGNLRCTTDPAGALTRYAYTDRGALAAMTDALGHPTTIAVNPAGLPLAFTDALGATWALARDARGRITAVTDPLGATTTTRWDGADNPVSRTSPDGSVQTWEWDANGGLVGHTDRAGGRTRFEYGPFSTVSARTDPDGARYTFAHDTERRLTSVTNPSGASWTYDYDAAGNLTGEQDFNGRQLTYQHDAAGLLVRRVNGAGQAVVLVRDALGQVVEQRIGEDRSAVFEYDPNGALRRAAGVGGEVFFTRDALGRVTAEGPAGRVLASEYDLLGRLTTRTTPGAVLSSWQYDPVGNPLALSTGPARPQGAAYGQIGFGHDAAGRETHRWLGSQVALTNEWDRLGRLTSRRVLGVEGTAQARTSRILHERAWTFRPDGAPLSVADTHCGLRRFDLDPVGRVTAVSAADWTQAYTYDAIGNLTRAADSRAADSATAGPRTVTGTLLRQAGRTSYEYDGQGRLVRAVRRTLSGGHKVWSYTYDAHDRMTEATVPSGDRWRYQYDPLGRRTAKQRFDPDGTPVEQVRFVWDGTRLAEQEHSAAGHDVLATTTWDYEPDSWTPVTQHRRVFARTSQELIDHQFHAIVTDLIGTPTELVDLGGRIAWRRTAGLWGDPGSGPAPAPSPTAGIPDADPSWCPLRFPGQYHDTETGLDYNTNRYYDSATGRYNTPDPLGLAPSPNNYGYVANPVYWRDPLGLAPAAGNPAPVPQVDNPRLQNIIDRLYKGVGNPQRIGDGTAMAATNHEVLGGNLVEARDHITKTSELSRAIENTLAADEIRVKGGKKIPNPKTPRDTEVANDLRTAIDDAQNGRYQGYQNYPGLAVDCP
ncbi:MAG TPA: RHS repeat-associated core domain-containing protein [Actinocrinis sp.]|nr:RHS repeat-associated core domain-containing protein [Actinocrinis sp.]